MRKDDEIMRIIDAREDYSLIQEYKDLIVNDNCSKPRGIQVLLDKEKTARRLSLYTSILGYSNAVDSVGDDWALTVKIGKCICPVA